MGDEAVDTSSHHIDLVRALQQLSAREREVVMLRHYAEWTALLSTYDGEDPLRVDDQLQFFRTSPEGVGHQGSQPLPPTPSDGN